DPNGFEGEIKLWTEEKREWESIPLLAERKFTGRSLGVADMAYAIQNDRSHRANGDLTLHVLDLMHAFHTASDEGGIVELSSGMDRPTPLFNDTDLSI
ncbi:MAG: hypothetical protein JXA25_08205, partial [Anaerolineales bacterium]|nr:hypothetical protein [Anaerolineales bacterium]